MVVYEKHPANFYAIIETLQPQTKAKDHGKNQWFVSYFSGTSSYLIADDRKTNKMVTGEKPIILSSK